MQIAVPKWYTYLMQIEQSCMDLNETTDAIRHNPCPKFKHQYFFHKIKFYIYHRASIRESSMYFRAFHIRQGSCMYDRHHFLITTKLQQVRNTYTLGLAPGQSKVHRALSLS